MNKKIFLLIPLLVFLQTCKKNVASVDDLTYSIVLIAGQSNTHYGGGLTPSLIAPMQGVSQLGRFGKDDLQIIRGEAPLQHHTKNNNFFGFGLVFAKLQRQYLGNGENILLVPCGYGGSGFNNNRWNKGDDLYNDALIRVKSIKDRSPKSKLVAILWHQGEQDVGSASYEDDLDNFITNIRMDLDAEDVPFIVGGMVPFWVDQNPDRIIQQAIIKNAIHRHHKLGYVDPEQPFRIEKENNYSDIIHYDAEGQIELGKRYFDQYRQLIE